MSEPSSIASLYDSCRTALKEAGIADPGLTARRLLKGLTDATDMEILTGGERPIPDAERIKDALRRHLSGEPLSRILGEREFWGLPFRVTPDVLDPRPDTEILIEAALRRFKQSSVILVKAGTGCGSAQSPLRILDLGTGSGCIIVALLTEFPDAQGIAVDISEKALAVAEENATRAGVADRLQFIQGDWGGEEITGKFDLIASNPPYIPNRDIPNLDESVRDYDPILALAGGEDGLDCYRILITKIKKHLKKDGAALFEIGSGQAKDVTRLVEESGLCVQGVHPDLAGILRVVEISFGEK